MGDACQVAFYVLAGVRQSANLVVCRLAMKAWEQGFRVLVLAPDEDAARSIDEAMWDLPAGRFLPHEMEASDEEVPVSIGVHGTAVAGGREVVINMADQSVPEPGRFRRLLEIVPAAEQHRIASRRKYREYRDMGLEPATHPIE